MCFLSDASTGGKGGFVKCLGPVSILSWRFMMKSFLRSFSRFTKDTSQLLAKVQLTLVISTSLISNNSLSRSENLVPA